MIIALCAALAFAGIDWVRAHVEVVTMHVRGKVEDYYPSLFIVDDPPGAWVRAERPDRLWLDPLRSNPTVEVHRGDRDVIYQAEVRDDEDEDPAQVDDLFRAKYGAVDLVAGWLLFRRDAVPIRLEPREAVADFRPSAPLPHSRSSIPHQTSRSRRSRPARSRRGGGGRR